MGIPKSEGTGMPQLEENDPRMHPHDIVALLTTERGWQNILKTMSADDPDRQRIMRIKEDLEQRLQDEITDWGGLDSVEEWIRTNIPGLELAPPSRLVERGLDLRWLPKDLQLRKFSPESNT